MNKLFISFLFLANSICAWWDSSHMAVAQIAQNRLTARARFRATDLISIFAEYNPASADFITASCWADDVKRSIFDFSTWHRQPLPYDPDQILNPKEKELIIIQAKENSLECGLQKCIDILKDRNGNAYDKGIALRLLIHLVADAHMPLHCASLYNRQFPNGDKGGNDFLLNHTLDKGFDNLHALWDSCILLDYYEFERPLTLNGKQQVAYFATALEFDFPLESLLEFINLDVKNWIQESYNLAISIAYQDITPNSSPSEEYLNKSKKAARRQLALAGYRLSHLLNEIFTN